MKHPALCRARRGLAVLAASGLLWDPATGPGPSSPVSTSSPSAGPAGTCQ